MQSKPGRRRIQSAMLRRLTIGVALAASWAGAGSLPAAERFIEVPGKHEFSGQMIARPWQPEALRERGLSPAEVEANGRMAREALGADILKHYPEVDEYIVRVRPNEGENRLAERLLATGRFEYVHPDWRCYGAVVPNDALYPNQWQHQRIHSEAGWDITVGNPSILVAICDSGVSPTHPDIQQVQGWNIPSGNTNTSDVTGHGTFSAGMAAAVGNNLQGVVGAGWNLKVMPVRVENAAGPPLSDINAGARWAADHGARIINCSYNGVADPSVETTGAYCRVRNALLFWAAGNDGVQLPNGDHPDVVIVSATTSADQLASFSNFGNLIDVAAPGENVWSTTSPNGYGSGGGTSAASPLAAGVAAMLLAIDPTLSTYQLEALLEGSCDDLGPAGSDVFFGEGRINLAQALSDAICATPLVLTSGVSIPTPVPAGYYQFHQGTNYWSAVATRGGLGTDWDLAVYQNPSGGSGTVCFSGPLANSVALAGTTDFVIGDFNHNAQGTYYVHAYLYDGTRDSRTEWDDGPDALTVNGPPVVRNVSFDDLIETWDVFLESGNEYTLNFNRTGGQASTKALLFRNPSTTYWVGRQARLVETSVPVAFTAPASDWYAVVVVNDNELSGSYTLNVGTCTAPIALQSGMSVQTSSPNGLYSFSQSVAYWSAVGVRGSGDWDVEVYQNGSGSDWPQCFSNQLAVSRLDPNLFRVDFVIGDFNHNPPGTYYVRALQASGAGNAVTEWDDSADQLLVGGPLAQRITNDSDVLEVWDVFLTGGVQYDLTFLPFGFALTEVFVFQSQNGVYWAGRSSRLLETQDAHTIFTAPADDWYAVVVVNHSGFSGGYQVGIALSPIAVNDPGQAPPAVTALRPVAPNPAYGGVQIAFDLAHAATVDFAILDVTGRIVGRVPAKAWAAGRWQAGWDGRSEDGRRVPAGVYWVEMSGGGPVARSKFTLLR